MTPAAAAICVAAAGCAIVGARVEVGDGTVLERATVVIRGGRIASVGPGAPPAGVPVVDGTGKVLAPGFVEARSQLGLVEVGMEKATVDHTVSGQPLVPAFRAADGFNPASVHFALAREEGVTSAVTHPLGGVLSGTGAWVDLGPSPSADPSRPVGLFGAVGAGAAQGVGGARGALWLKLREAFADARFYARNRAAVDRNAARTLALPPLHLEALLPVVEGRLPLVLEANRASDIRAALAFAREQKVRLVIAGGAEAWAVAAELAGAKVPVILTPSSQDPASFETLRARDDAATVLDRAGVPLLLSTASWDQNLRRLRQEAGLAAAFGLPRGKALRAITLGPAEAFGKAGELGSVAAGKRANLVLWSGDPLELSSIAERVLVDGVEVPLDTRQRKLAERYR